jgi:hypothetical protein
VAYLFLVRPLPAPKNMNGKKLLKMAVGFLCVWFALASALRIPPAIARLRQADNQQRGNNMASMTSVEAFYLYGAFAGVVLWGGVSFYLFRSAKKDKHKPDA